MSISDFYIMITTSISTISYTNTFFFLKNKIYSSFFSNMKVSYRAIFVNYSLIMAFGLFEFLKAFFLYFTQFYVKYMSMCILIEFEQNFMGCSHNTKKKNLYLLRKILFSSFCFTFISLVYWENISHEIFLNWKYNYKIAYL